MAEREEKPTFEFELFEDGTGRVVSANGSCWDLDREEVAKLRDAMDRAEREEPTDAT